MAQYLPPESLKVGNGVETVFGFSFPYLRIQDVAVTVNGVTVPTVLVGTAQVSVTPAPAVGAAIRIYRNTPAQFPAYQFATGVPMLPRYIDENNRQLLYGLQEGLLQFTATQTTAEEALRRAAAAEIAAANAAASAAQQATDMRRTVRVPTTDPEIPTLPPVAARAGKVLGFNSVGHPIGVLPLSGSGTEVAMDLADPITQGKGGWMVGVSQTGAGAVPRTVAAKFRESVSVLDYFGNPENNISLAIIAALAVHNTVHIPPGDWYGGPASAADEYLVVMMREGKRVVFMPGARVFFGQTGTTYLPFFASISETGWAIDNPSFVWTGRIQWSASGDLQYAVPDPISPLVTRLGAPHAYQAYIFNAAILALSSHGFKITNFKIESLDPSRPILQGISTARTTGKPVEVHGLALDDTNIGIMAQGGDTLIVTNIKQGRSNQDIGIPGHAVYSFVTNTYIDGVIDSGEETGALRQSGYTVSYKGGGVFQLSNVNSKRVFGPVGWATAAGKAERITLTNIVWVDNPAVPVPADGNPVIYNAGTTDGNDSTVLMSNVVLSTTRDRPMLGGHMRAVSGDITLRRSDSVAATTPYLYGRFIGCDLKLRLVQRGVFDAPVLKMQSGGATLLAGNTLRCKLDGFNGSPVIDYTLSDGRWQSNSLIFSLPVLKPDGTANPSRSLGSPDAVMPGTTISTQGQNYIGTTDTTATWHRTFPAGTADIVAHFPISAGTYTVDVLLTTAGSAWRRLTRYLVTSYRPDGVGAYMNAVQQVGTAIVQGNTPLAPGVDIAVTVPDPTDLRVACTIVAAAALAAPVTVHCSTSKVSF